MADFGITAREEGKPIWTIPGFIERDKSQLTEEIVKLMLLYAEEEK